jgi:hypothetical protein
MKPRRGDIAFRRVLTLRNIAPTGNIAMKGRHIHLYYVVPSERGCKTSNNDCPLLIVNCPLSITPWLLLALFLFSIRRALQSIHR